MKSINTAARPVAARLNSAAPGLNLNPRDAHAIMCLCPFEAVAKGRFSPFRSMFSEDVETYEYTWDLFYNRGYALHPSITNDPLLTVLFVKYVGSLEPVQSVGYINELIGYLMNSPAQHCLQTNKTLLSSPKTFPLDRAVCVVLS